MNSFFVDHMTKHLQSYEKCYTGPSFEALPTNEEKDRAFMKCHNSWISDLKSNVSFELEVKARDLFGGRPAAESEWRLTVDLQYAT